MTLTFNLRIFFTKNPNPKKKIFFIGGGGGGGKVEGGGGVWGWKGGRGRWMDRCTSPNQFAPSTCSTRQQLCKIILKSMHKCPSYGPDKLIYDHFDLYLTLLTWTFSLPEKMFQMALLLLEDNNCAKLF